MVDTPMALSDTGPRDARGQWQPAGPRPEPPLFAWPPRPLAVFKWLFGFPGDLWPWTSLYVLIALGTWLYLQPEIARCATFEFDWIAQLYGRTLALLILIVSGWHLHLYVRKAQGLQYKYSADWLSTSNRKFLWGNQLWDNVFWNCASGVSVWTAYETLMMWAYANEMLPYVDWREAPVYFVALLAAIPNSAMTTPASTTPTWARSNRFGNRPCSGSIGARGKPWESGSFHRPWISHWTSRSATSLSISVVMISLTPIRALATAGPSANNPPPTTAAASMAGTRTGPGQPSPIRATHVAPIAAAMIWPSAPMFQRPFEPATATAKPARPNGTARFKVTDQAREPPRAASNIRS